MWWVLAPNCFSWMVFKMVPCGSNFQKIVEDKCEQMKLNFVFGLDSEEGPIIGCQTTSNAKSAIMFRQSKKNNNKITIAALSFYEPLLNKFID